jgi:hypothetical protein
MLDPEQVWVLEFKKLPPASTAAEGLANLANTIEKLTNKVEPVVPGGTASPGVFQWNKAAFISQVASLTPTAGSEWIQKISNAWFAGCSSGIITPGLVSAPSLWPVSSTDVNTLPSVPSTVPTVTAGKAALEGLMAAMPALMSTNPAQAPEMFAKAFYAGVKAFTFVLIGIAGSPGTPVPLPVTATAK